MGDVHRFPLEMQPARPFPPALHPEPEFHPVTDDQLALLDTQDALERLAFRIGWRRLATITRNLAHLNGCDVERPAHRCLADGASLINNICVQCGRDNQ